MTPSLILSAISIAASLVATMETAYAAQPPDVVQSDANSNTAMGTGAMAQAPGDTYDNTAVGWHALSAGPGGGMCCGGNTAVGSSALSSDTSGWGNTGVGLAALTANDTGNGNSAIGFAALGFNTVGAFNTASGNWSLRFNVSGSNNSASGGSALFNNTTGNNNAASGANALACNTTGNYNTAAGAFALSGDAAPGGFPYPACPTGFATGSYNSASGAAALSNNTTGYQNTASGSYALYSSSVGNHNTASGSNALFSNTTGITNVAVGLEALYSNTTGSNNIAVGTNAGYNLTYGNNNIDIGNEGVATEGGTIRIGTPGTQTTTYIAGIESAKVTGSAVYVTASGQLGVLASSERYKTDIARMGASSKKLTQLRPVSFHLKSDPDGAVQYGLIAEEVNKVYPELVLRDAAGNIQGVRYDELAPLLLNETQSQAAEIRDLKKLVIEMQAGLMRLQARETFVAEH